MQPPGCGGSWGARAGQIWGAGCSRKRVRVWYLHGRTHGWGWRADQRGLAAARWSTGMGQDTTGKGPSDTRAGGWGGGCSEMCTYTRWPLRCDVPNAPEVERRSCLCLVLGFPTASGWYTFRVRHKTKKQPKKIVPKSTLGQLLIYENATDFFWA